MRSSSPPKHVAVALDSALARYFLCCQPLELGATTSPASSHLPPSAVAHCRFDLSPPSLPRACFAPLQVRGEVPDRFPSFPTSIRSCSLCLMLVVVAMAIALSPRTSSLAPGRPMRVPNCAPTRLPGPGQALHRARARTAVLAGSRLPRVRPSRPPSDGVPRAPLLRCAPAASATLACGRSLAAALVRACS